MDKNNPKTIFAWTFYDWANSVYSLVITSTIFPIYYSLLTTDSYREVYSFQDKIIHEPVRSQILLFGKHYEPDSLFSYSLTLSFIIVVLATPVLSSVADTLGAKKKFLKFFCYLGALSCIGLFFFTDKSLIKYGLLLNITSSIGFWGSLVFYNSFLPDIATKDRQDKISARGYMMGYLGSVILLIICIILIQTASLENRPFYIRLCFLLTGLWWAGFAQFTFARLPNGKKNGTVKRGIVKNSFRTLKNIQTELFKDRSLKYFLLSFFCFSIGMQTIFLMATLFGSNELNLDASILIICILAIQIIAIFGAFLCSTLAKKIGNKKVLIGCITIWIIICSFGFVLDKTDPNADYYFYTACGLVGLVMGGIQSLSRSTYSKMLPPKDVEATATYFSFYDVMEKCAIIVGTSAYGYLIELTGNMRYSILAMSIAFILSLLFILLVNAKKINT
ncbi:MAG: MFS transporter [Flavobacteriaceae bacterium]|jgi:UMF1 family MFS transporter|nr:MFS transporter [Flavobacteriaceae bacterium]